MSEKNFTHCPFLIGMELNKKIKIEIEEAQKIIDDFMSNNSIIKKLKKLD